MTYTASSGTLKLYYTIPYYTIPYYHSFIHSFIHIDGTFAKTVWFAALPLKCAQNYSYRLRFRCRTVVESAKISVFFWGYDVYSNERDVRSCARCGPTAADIVRQNWWWRFYGLATVNFTVVHHESRLCLTAAAALAARLSVAPARKHAHLTQLTAQSSRTVICKVEVICHSFA